jgi:hypothetical protein
MATSMSFLRRVVQLFQNMILLVLLRFLVFRRYVQQNLSQFRHAVIDSHRYLLERRMVVEVVTNIEVLLLETKHK